MDPQVVGGWALFLLGLLGAGLTLAAAAAIVIVRLYIAGTDGLVASDANPGAIIAQVFVAIFTTPLGGLLIVSLVFIHFGLIMLQGGAFMGWRPEFDDPTPPT